MKKLCSITSLFLTTAVLLSATLLSCKSQNDEAQEAIKKAHEAAAKVEEQAGKTLDQANKMIKDASENAKDAIDDVTQKAKGIADAAVATPAANH